MPLLRSFKIYNTDHLPLEINSSFLEELTIHHPFYARAIKLSHPKNLRFLSLKGLDWLVGDYDTSQLTGLEHLVLHARFSTFEYPSSLQTLDIDDCHSWRLWLDMADKLEAGEFPVPMHILRSIKFENIRSNPNGHRLAGLLAEIQANPADKS